MITCELKGGLGNQLFQIFTVIAYSLDNKVAFKFLYTTSIPSVTPRHSYWDSFLKTLKFFTVTQLPRGFARVPHKEHFHYIELPNYKSLNHEHVCLHGYFQSYKYFHHKQNDIYRLIKLSEQQKYCLNKYNYNANDMKNTISVHFRLGDYKHLSHSHPIMPVQYYTNAFTYILSKKTNQKYTVYYFCEKEDNTRVESDFIRVISFMFPSLKFVKVSDEMEDWEQILLMSCCQHNIIANSSFSWFGAYFNTSPTNSIVCYPEVWFSGSAAESNNTKDMFLPQWNQIRC